MQCVWVKKTFKKPIKCFFNVNGLSRVWRFDAVKFKFSLGKYFSFVLNVNRLCFQLIMMTLNYIKRRKCTPCCFRFLVLKGIVDHKHYLLQNFQK